MMNVAVDWYTNPHTVDNWGHGYSSEYQRGSFLRSLKRLKVCKTWQACITLRNNWNSFKILKTFIGLAQLSKIFCQYYLPDKC